MWNGQRITLRRQAIRVSQEELADQVGTNQKQISRYERGENVPTADVLATIARALDTTADWLLGMTEDPARPMRDESDLSEDEQQLLILYRQMTAEKRRQLVEVARIL